jgi:hypothetical protein
MKRNFSFLQIFIIGATIIVLQACSKEELADLQIESASESSPLKSQTTQTFNGPTVPVGNGIARAWIKQDKNGIPSAVGITLSEKALEKLPDHIEQYVLEFPDHAGSYFYTHALVDWNPQGHEPPGIYDLPHFDVHFYIISNEDRLAIGPNDDAQFENIPAANYIPPQYVKIPDGVPQMGAHWIDVLSPEFNGGIFTKTFIWGSYDGEFIFWEPMFTMDYLLSQPNDEVPLRLPDAYQRDGWYATKYKISYSTRPGEYNIALTGLTYRSASPPTN